VLQSGLEARLPELLPRLDTYERDGALWARSSEYGDDQDRVLLRSETHEPTYRAADVVYLVDKLERGFDRAIYVLGADHHGTRNWYAAVARMLGYDPQRVEVLLYQLVHLMRGGEQAKMSKRRGDVVFLDEFMDEIGVDAARWYLVNRSPDQAIEIDVDLAAERSEKNPVYYVQYAHARICSIWRQVREQGITVPPWSDVDLDALTLPEEQALIKRLVGYPDLVAGAARALEPHRIAYWLTELAGLFHPYYKVHRVIQPDTRRMLARLALLTAVGQALRNGLDLLGVSAPETM
jgi:arginyl-tRNA synthetase